VAPDDCIVIIRCTETFWSLCIKCVYLRGRVRCYQISCMLYKYKGWTCWTCWIR